MFDINQLSIWIVTYNRPDALNQAISDFLESTPENVPINVISNHSKLNLFKDYGSRVRVWMNNLRSDESWGYLSRNWNQCFYLGLRDYEWILCSQDDVRVKKGWIELIQQNPHYDFYTASYFDVVFMLNQSAFKKIGWFDERFIVMDYHDNDYLRRAYQKLGREKICAEDKHGWMLNGKFTGFINPINLSKYWIHSPEEGYKQPDDHPRGRGKEVIHNRANTNFLYEKWGAIIKINHQELNLKQRIPDIDWYPWFTKYIFEKTGESYPEEKYLKEKKTVFFDSLLIKLKNKF